MGILHSFLNLKDTRVLGRHDGVLQQRQRSWGDQEQCSILKGKKRLLTATAATMGKDEVIEEEVTDGPD